ncbi:hypothetical protein [Winogradskyella costae]|uniref:hypothetical protein n=1 Tax=Winogradskyella costae TaxID=2697008 RepID=UPI0015C71921|nr:hypothetical protein [Winogradskyella costae]
MKDIIKSFLDASRERIKNPLIGTFIISWIAINWRPIMILLFSDQKVENRIDYIITHYSSFQTYFLVPFIIALIYVIILPYFMWAVDELIRKSTIGRKNNLLKQTIYDYEGKHQIAIAESKLEDFKASYRDKADFNNQIKQLRNQLDEREESLQIQQMEIDQYEKELNEFKNSAKENNSELNISTLEKKFSEFEKTDLFDYFKDVGVSIRNNRNFPNGINEIIKEKFLMQEIVEEVVEENDFYYRFTTVGNYYWKRYVTNLRVEKRNNIKDDISPDDLPF